MPASIKASTLAAVVRTHSRSSALCAAIHMLRRLRAFTAAPNLA